MSHFVITGANGGVLQGAAAPNRIEINDFVKIQDQFSLYIQALNAMFKTPQSSSTSHFSIGGIHGLPYIQWEGAGGTHPVKGSQWSGYCTHGSVLFPTWHRPYVALYEQVLQQHALDIAKTYQVDQQSWLTAAQNLRAPYWDWATNTVPPPEVISLETVDIITPDGNTTSVANPLLGYTFNPIDRSFPSPYKYWQTTIRHPDDPRSPNATTDVQALTDDLSSIQDDITSSTYSLLTRVHTWPAFSNHTRGDGGSASNSLEAIHDEIHGIIGGQMGDPAVAGFDPVFFLHHANVDRLLSLWAAVNPGVWVTRGPAEGGTFTISGNAVIDNNTNLTPFWDSQTGFWASSETTTTAKLQYTYPEFNGLKLDNPGAVQVAIANYINQQYGGGSVFSSLRSTGPAISLLAQPPAGSGAAAPAAQGTAPTSTALSAVASAAPAVVHPFASRGGPPHKTETEKRSTSAPNVVHDWVARIHFKKYELGESFAVLIFLGEVPADASLWRTSPSFVGAHVAFVNSAADQCANCSEQADIVAEGFVHLNTAIAKRSGLSSLDPSVVSPYLQENLHWRIQSVDRSAVEGDRLPSLEIAVAATPLTQEPGSVFPIAGEPHYHHHITHGRQGGSRHALA
ncbi:tyrosinase [Multifurca ochricompacta]|uniref:tyrosinase n=1 Tax=Multifurca ochricompacta TaxID=376703 RepID=A0AAD4M928_9AGAM|nr:tyrosinase [Multifurca ochricompacta]